MEERRDIGPAGLLVSAKEAAALCGMSLRTWWRKDSAGHVPAAVRIGGGSMKRWRLEELRDWCNAGCPPRKEWEVMAAVDSKGR